MLFPASEVLGLFPALSETQRAVSNKSLLKMRESCQPWMWEK